MGIDIIIRELREEAFIDKYFTLRGARVIFWVVLVGLANQEELEEYELAKSRGLAIRGLASQ